MGMSALLKMLALFAVVVVSALLLDAMGLISRWGAGALIHFSALGAVAYVAYIATSVEGGTPFRWDSRGTTGH